MTGLALITDGQKGDEFGIFPGLVKHRWQIAIASLLEGNDSVDISALKALGSTVLLLVPGQMRYASGAKFHVDAGLSIHRL